VVAPDLLAAVQGYGRRLHDHALRSGPAHHVASPLGAWLLLAILSDLPGATEAEGFSDALGADATAARAHALRVLASPPPAVQVGAAAWSRPLPGADAVDRWTGALPGVIPTGPLPGQADLDAWAARSTGGLVERFPLDLDPDTFLLLATALATRVQWDAPFAPVPASDLGAAHPWAVQRALFASGPQGRVVEHGGRLLGVHVAQAPGLAVVSVVDERDAEPAVTLASALDLAPSAATGTLAGTSVWDLPGDGHAWTLREEQARGTAADDRPELVEVVLPAWTASTRLDLVTETACGFAGLAATVQALVPERFHPVEVEAAQRAVAGFDTAGFEAAAVTAVGFLARGAVPPQHEVTRRVATIRFDRPFAAVAVATDQRWWGLPVFSAWVAEAVEPSDPS
jgi:hypothetical protein